MLIIVMRALNVLYVNVIIYTFYSMLCKLFLTYKRVLYLIKYSSSSNLYLNTNVIDIKVFSASLTCFEIFSF